MLLKEEDFETVTTLSTSGPFAHVDLIRARPSLSSENNTQVFVSKTVERTWAYRTRGQNSIRNELDILLLSRSHPDAAMPMLIGSVLSDYHCQLILSHAVGGDLATFLYSQGNDRIDEGLVVRWMGETMEAITWLHAKGWCHRDVKPNNLLINQDGKILLTDFGSAAPLVSSNLTKGPLSVMKRNARVLIGTPDYIAPEILRFAESMVSDNSVVMDDEADQNDGDQRAYGQEVDIWSFGVVIYEVCLDLIPPRAV
jgi:serine/threonine protein kinase